MTPTVSTGRREFSIACPSCNHITQVPPSAIARNSFFCGMCGKSIDLHGIFRQPAGEAPTFSARRDKGTSRYKSARKARR